MKKKTEVLLTGSTKMEGFHILGLESKDGMCYELRMEMLHKIKLNGVISLKIKRTVTHLLTNEQFETLTGFPIVAKLSKKQIKK